MEELRRGNLDTRVEIRSGDEMEYLGESFNQMAKDLGLKSKDLTDLLANKGLGDVKSQKTLSEQEFNDFKSKYLDKRSG